MIPIAWIGLWLNLNTTAPIRHPFNQPGIFAEATAITQVGKLTITTIYAQPLRSGDKPLLSLSAGVRLF